MYPNDIFLVIYEVDPKNVNRIVHFRIDSAASNICFEVNEHRRTAYRYWRAFTNYVEAYNFLIEKMDGEDQYYYGIDEGQLITLDISYRRD